MLKNYRMPNGHIYQYEDGKQPAEAVEVKKAAAKAEKPKANKARAPKGTK